MTVHRSVSVASEDRVLAGTLVTPEAPSGAGVLFVHGLGSSRMTNVERADSLARTHAVTCLAIDLGGHGDSTGQLSRMTPRRNLADVVAAYDLLRSVTGVDREPPPDSVDPGRIGVCAASYGAYLSIPLSALRPVSRMLLRAPALYADDTFDQGLAQRRPGNASTAPTLLAHLALYAGPVTIVESEHDEVIGHELISAYLAAQPRAAHIVQPGARHALTDPVTRAAFQRILEDFFATL